MSKRLERFERFREWQANPDRKLVDYVGKVVYFGKGSPMIVMEVNGNFKALVGINLQAYILHIHPNNNIEEDGVEYTKFPIKEKHMLACYVKDVYNAHNAPYFPLGRYTIFPHVYYNRDTLT